jgi:hypothetical protein
VHAAFRGMQPRRANALNIRHMVNVHLWDPLFAGERAL